MIPIRTSVDVRGVPGAVIGLIIANVVVFLVQSGLPADLAKQFIHYNALVPGRYTDPEVARQLGLDPGNFLPFLTNTFMHVGWLHLIVNMWTLWLFGRPLEQRLGAPRFILLYLACGAVASLAHFAFNFYSPIPALGASGAIAGLLGGYTLLYPRAQIVLITPVLFFPVTYRLTAMAYTTLWFVFQLLPGLAELFAPEHTGGIAWWAHIGGFVAGLALIRLVGTQRRREREVGSAPAGMREIGAQRPRIVRVAPQPLRHPRSANAFDRLTRMVPAPAPADTQSVPHASPAAEASETARSLIPEAGSTEAAPQPRRATATPAGAPQVAARAAPRPSKRKLLTFIAVLFVGALAAIAYLYEEIGPKLEATLKQFAQPPERAIDKPKPKDVAKPEEQPNAQFQLGWLHEKGKGVPQDYAEAVKWYRKAAVQGHLNAQYNLGILYMEGRGVAQDYGEAVKWYRKAADQHNGRAQGDLGFMYEKGLGVQKDVAEAVKWYRKAAERGDALGQNNLGIMYKRGQGVPRNLVEALSWIKVAAGKGLALAQFNLAGMLLRGQGAAKDDAEAAKWYRKAAEQGYARAQSVLGYMYRKGRGVAKDYEGAVKWYRKAAEQVRWSHLVGQFGGEVKPTFPIYHPNSWKSYHFPTAKGTVSPMQPSDGMILVIGPRLEGHSVIFLAIQTHLSCRFLLAVDSLGLRRSGSSSQIINQAQDFPEQVPRHRHLSQLERNVAAMSDNLGPDLHQLVAQRRHRPVLHLLRQSQCPHEVAQIVGQGVKLEPNGIVAELAT